MKNTLILLFIFALSACSQKVEKTECTPEKKIDLKALTWLLGEWKSVNDKLISYEIWQKKDDRLFYGQSFTLRGSDTLFKESITLQQNGADLFYIPTVNDQNGSKPVPFKFTKIKDGEFYFENSEHDFPQQIIYKNPQPDFLCARIAGMTEGKYHQEDFNFVRVK